MISDIFIPGLYQTVLLGYGLLGLAALVTLFFIPAPYGRFSKPGWGPVITNRAGWLIMEAPASLLFFLIFVFGNQPKGAAAVTFLVIWQSHYLQRAFIYPLLLPLRRNMPLSIIAMGVLFNLVNVYLQAGWLYFISSPERYNDAWLTDPRFISGTVIFITGYVINRHADAVLRRLRQPGQKEYRLPRGGLFRFVSCPNYLGEIIQWLGWALATFSLPGLLFAFWTMANLAPRALAHHRWYQQRFTDYPRQRRALLPFLW